MKPSQRLQTPSNCAGRAARASSRASYAMLEISMTSLISRFFADSDACKEGLLNVEAAAQAAAGRSRPQKQPTAPGAATAQGPEPAYYGRSVLRPTKGGTRASVRRPALH